MYKGLAVQFYNIIKGETQDTSMIAQCLNKMHQDGFDLQELLDSGLLAFEKGLVESILKKPKEDPLINSKEFAGMLEISKQAFHQRYKRSLNPNSESDLPVASYSQDGKNPMWYLSVVQTYVVRRKMNRNKKSPHLK